MMFQIIRFSIVGALGAAVNLAIFSLLVLLMGLNHNIASAVAFLFAVTQNFVINRVWTFGVQESDQSNIFWSWGKYVSVNLIGLAVNLALLNLLIEYGGADWALAGQFCGIIGASGFDFLLSKFWVFQTHTRSVADERHQKSKEDIL